MHVMCVVCVAKLEKGGELGGRRLTSVSCDRSNILAGPTVCHTPAPHHLTFLRHLIHHPSHSLPAMYACPSSMLVATLDTPLAVVE